MRSDCLASAHVDSDSLGGDHRAGCHHPCRTPGLRGAAFRWVPGFWSSAPSVILNLILLFMNPGTTALTERQVFLLLAFDLAQLVASVVADGRADQPVCGAARGTCHHLGHGAVGTGDAASGHCGGSCRHVACNNLCAAGNAGRHSPLVCRPLCLWLLACGGDRHRLSGASTPIASPKRCMPCRMRCSPHRWRSPARRS